MANFMRLIYELHFSVYARPRLRPCSQQRRSGTPSLIRRPPPVTPSRSRLQRPPLGAVLGQPEGTDHRRCKTWRLVERSPCSIACQCAQPRSQALDPPPTRSASLRVPHRSLCRGGTESLALRVRQSHVHTCTQSPTASPICRDYAAVVLPACHRQRPLGADGGGKGGDRVTSPPPPMLQPSGPSLQPPRPLAKLGSSRRHFANHWHRNGKDSDAHARWALARARAHARTLTNLYALTKPQLFTHSELTHPHPHPQPPTHCCTSTPTV
jgi:hypothetical protein